LGHPVYSSLEINLSVVIQPLKRTLTLRNCEALKFVQDAERQKRYLVLTLTLVVIQVDTPVRRFTFDLRTIYILIRNCTCVKINGWHASLPLYGMIAASNVNYCWS
jgi:hypothetical protein